MFDTEMRSMSRVRREALQELLLNIQFLFSVAVMNILVDDGLNLRIAGSALTKFENNNRHKLRTLPFKDIRDLPPISTFSPSFQLPKF